MKDITIIATTLNKLPECWQRYYKKMILEAADGAPLITLSKRPMDYGLNVIQTEKEIAKGMTNIYWQILKGAKMVKTPYIGIAEDDTLYPRAHFAFRPPLDTVAYNRSRWAILTWETKNPFYFYKPRSGNCVAIAPRDLMIEALEERFAKFPVFPTPLEVAGNVKEKRYGLKKRKHMKFNTIEPVVNLNHIYSHNPVERRKRKKAKPIRAYDILKWGHVSNVLKHYYG